MSKLVSIPILVVGRRWYLKWRKAFNLKAFDIDIGTLFCLCMDNCTCTLIDDTDNEEEDESEKDDN